MNKPLLFLISTSILLFNGCVSEESRGTTTTTITDTSTSIMSTSTLVSITPTTSLTTTHSGTEMPGFSEIKIPAVDSEGNGVIIDLTVEVLPGRGRTLTDIDNLLFWVDTQHSIRKARKIAINVTKMDLSNIDLIYTIYANASVIGGESAGAAITIATIAAIQNKRINNSVIMTGQINHDGSLGPVSAIVEKANASKKENATLFLVPLLQSRDVIYETKKHCEKIGWTEFCTIEQVPKKVSVEDVVDIRVREVGDIREAMKYFFSG